MGTFAEPALTKIVVSVIYGREEHCDQVLDQLSRMWGTADVVGEKRPFDWTSYYEREMGSPLARRICSFEKLVPASSLVSLKHTASELEAALAEAPSRGDRNNRTVNVDPGLLSLSNFTLATTKSGAHRIYLDRGVYADLTLVYERGEFRAIPWTYPDFASAYYRRFLEDIRKIYKQQLKSSSRCQDVGSAL